MVNLFKGLKKGVGFLVYRFRYLFNYIIIGFFSILLELLIIKALIPLGFSFILSVLLGFSGGVFFSFFLNAKLNFRVPKSKNTRTFFLFLSISIVAFTLNLIIIWTMRNFLPLYYSAPRLISATMVFLLSYTAHRKITFDFVKKVGVAVYLNKTENISQIYSKIKYYPDFIHLDLIDNTIKKDASEIDLSLIAHIDKTWGLEKMLHIMSKKPSIWIEKLKNSVGTIIFHIDLDEPIEKVILLCKKYHKKIGLVLDANSDIEDLEEYFPYLNFVQVMGISNLGISGQGLDLKSLKKVNKLEEFKKRYNFEIIFDGGVKTTNISKINAKYIVSASSLLTSEDPLGSFMKLKTNSRYFPVVEELKKDIFLGVKKIAKSTDFIKSLTFVGSFLESKKGINDIDTIVIIDELTKYKFEEILRKFTLLKKELETKYAYPVIINPTLGPLKFNEKDIVFHLMIYDTNLHKDHCEKSPFTCLDWQRSKIFFKKSMSEIASVKFLQPSYFFNFRRSAKEYLSEINSDKISYRKYVYKKGCFIQEKLYKDMTQRDKVEFSYHIFKFLISNFLKLYHKKNEIYYMNRMLKTYFNIFPKNKKIHLKLIGEIEKNRVSKTFAELSSLKARLRLFLEDFESQFRDYFYNDSKEIIFLRHAEIVSSEKKKFIGQNLNPKLKKVNKEKIKGIRDNLGHPDVIFSSPSERCQKTLKLITNKSPILKDSLTEIDYGKLEGKDIKYLSSNHPSIIEAWNRGEDPKFPGGENTQDVIKRVKYFMGDLIKRDERKILVCTHNVVLRSIIGAYLRLPMKDWFKLNVPYLQPIKFIITKYDKFYIDLEANQIKELFKNF